MLDTNVIALCWQVLDNMQILTSVKLFFVRDIVTSDRQLHISFTFIAGNAYAGNTGPKMIGTFLMTPYLVR